MLPNKCSQELAQELHRLSLGLQEFAAAAATPPLQGEEVMGMLPDGKMAPCVVREVHGMPQPAPNGLAGAAAAEGGGEEEGEEEEGGRGALQQQPGGWASG